MAQSILIQEAALKRLQARVQELESELAAQKANPRRAAVSSAACLWQDVTRSLTTAGMPSRNSTGAGLSRRQRYSRRRFVAGALQTAAGGRCSACRDAYQHVPSVAAGDREHHRRPTMPVGGEPFVGNQYGDVNNVSDTRFLNQNDPFGSNNDIWQNDDVDDDYSNDDDSFI
jgi:hypothetical protein